MRENKGITLIALIITIIILIILTAVTLNNVIGTDLIGFAGSAAGNYIDAEKEEEEKISELMSKAGDAVPSTPTTGGTGETGGIGSTEVSGKLKEYQGKYVDIGLDINDSENEDGTKNTTDDWEIFYATEDRIFLIAADYVPVTKLTDWNVIGDNGSLSDKGFKQYSDYKYGVYWKSPTTFLQLPTEPTNFLDLVMHKGCDLENYSSSYSSIAVSHLLNTKAWEGIKTAAEKKDSIDFVIGGPTFEMWCEAWKAAIVGNPYGLVGLEAYTRGTDCFYSVKYGETSNVYLFVNGSATYASTPAPDILGKYTTFFPHTKPTENCTRLHLGVSLL